MDATAHTHRLVHRLYCSQEDFDLTSLLPNTSVPAALSPTNRIAFAHQHQIYCSKQDGEDIEDVEPLLVSERLNLEVDEEITDLLFINHDTVAASYTTGYLRVFNTDGSLQFSQQFHSSSIRSLKMHSAPLSTASELWLLYHDATIVILQTSDILSRISSILLYPAQVTKFRKYSLRDQAESVAAIPCGSPKPSIFQSHPRIGVYTIISVGAGPFVSFYQAGNDQNSIIHLAHIATAMASKAAGAVWSFAKSWTPFNGEQSVGETEDMRGAADHVPAPLGGTFTVSEDYRRRCRQMIVSPNGRLAVIADTLGRVSLLDTSRMMVIRMWKGYRKAQVAWMHCMEGKDRKKGLYLVIYSATRGMIDIWRPRYGPKVFSLAVGNNARLLGDIDRDEQNATCVVATPSDTVGEMDVMELLPTLADEDAVLKYFNKSKLQEETFLLHQITGKLHASVISSDVWQEIEGLSSFGSIQSLHETLYSSEFDQLPAKDFLNALKSIEVTLAKTLHEQPLEAVTLRWQVMWHVALLSGFVQLTKEFNNSRKAIKSAQPLSEQMLGAYSGPNDETNPSDVLPWLELYLRAGVTSDGDMCTNFVNSIEAAGRMSGKRFLEYFSSPFTDVSLAKNKQLVAVFDQSIGADDFLRKALDTLQQPVLQRKCPDKAPLLSLLFVPVLTSVFTVQELQRIHGRLFLSKEVLPSLFMEWFLSLPFDVLLSIPPASTSSGLQRFLQPCFDQLTFEEEEEEEPFDPIAIRRQHLSSYPDLLSRLFTHCSSTHRVIHACVLCDHLAFGEEREAERAEEQSLGKFRNVEGGMRWTVLRSCLSKTVHLSLRLGRAGRLSAAAVEGVDDIMRVVALLQLNSSTKHTQALGENEKEDWAAALLETSQLKDWTGVLACYPQLSNGDALGCFRAIILCTAWNASRAELHQFEDALVEIESLSSAKLRAAMCNLVWEDFVRSHVATLVSFWEDSAQGKRTGKGLQPQAARRFFAIVKSLIEMLQLALKHLEQDSAGTMSTIEDNEEEEEEEEEEEDCSDEEEEHSQTVLSDLIDTKHWRTSVVNLPTVFQRHWPPSSDASDLMTRLYAFDPRSVSRQQVSDHVSLLLLLDSFVLTNVTPTPLSRLYPPNARSLCCLNTFTTSTSDATSKREEERTAFLRKLLRHDDKLGFKLAEAFELPTQVIREEQVVFLYESGQDEAAEASFEKLNRPERIAEKLASIARARLSLILQRMKAAPEYARVMSILPADVHMWVINDSQPPLVADKQVAKLDKEPSLTATHYLLLRCLSLLPEKSLELEKATSMSVVVKDVIQQVKKHQASNRT